MYFLNPRPTATSLKHCLQKFSPYFLTMGPYCPQRLHGRAPFPYFRTFLGFILAIWFSASYLSSEVFLDELDSILFRDIVALADFRGANGATSQTVSWPFESNVNGGAEDAQLRNIPGTGYFDVFLNSEGKITIVVKA